MPVKILLADKSITIQKVVEMLFSGRDYEVVCASDGETALNDAARVVPDVVLVDVDLPRIDGYSFAARLKQTPQFAQTPVILMMSRDDVYDGAKGNQAGIVDNIAKPFESQELIGKVKKALAAAAPRAAEPGPPPVRPPAAPAPPEARPAPAAAPPSPPPSRPVQTPALASPPKPKKETPADIFDIISEAPSPADLARAATETEEETIYEVEPVVEEVEEPLNREETKMLPVGDKAVAEMRAGLGLAREKEEPQPEVVTYESVNRAPGPPPMRPASSPVPATTLSEADMRRIAEEITAKMAKDIIAQIPPAQPQIAPEALLAMVAKEAMSKTKEALAAMPALSAGEVRGIAEEVVANAANDIIARIPPVQPQVSRETLRAMIAEEFASRAKVVSEAPPMVQPPALTASDVWSAAEDAVQKIAREYFDRQPSQQSPQLSDADLRGMVEAKVSSMANEALARMPGAAQPSALSPSDMWSMADEAVQKIAREYFEKQPLTQTARQSDESLKSMVEEAVSKTAAETLEIKAGALPTPISRSELMKMAEETVSRMALELFSDMKPQIPKISEDTVRRGIEEAVLKIAQEIARDVIEKVAWDTVPRLAEVLIKEEIERLKAME